MGTERLKLKSLSPLKALAVALLVSTDKRWSTAIAKRNYARQLAQYKNEIQDHHRAWNIPLLWEDGELYAGCSVNGVQGFFRIDLNAPQSWISGTAFAFCNAYSKMGRIMTFGMPYQTTCQVGGRKFTQYGGCKAGYCLDKESINKIKIRKTHDIATWGVIGFDILNPYASERVSTIEWDTSNDCYCLIVFEPQ